MNKSVALMRKKTQELFQRQAPEISRALPPEINNDRFMRFAQTAVSANPKIMECTPESLSEALLQSAQLGLYPDGILGQAYLIPYGRSVKLIPGYKGMLTLARKSKELAGPIIIEEVYDSDEFDYEIGDDPFIKHKPDKCNPRTDWSRITHFYMIVEYKETGKQRLVWTRSEMDAHVKQYCKDATSSTSPWKTAYPQMAKKTLVRAMVSGGMLPISTDLQQNIALEVQAEVDFYKEQLSRNPVVPGRQFQAITNQMQGGDVIEGSVSEPEPEAPKKVTKKKAPPKREAPKQETQEEFYPSEDEFAAEPTQSIEEQAKELFE